MNNLRVVRVETRNQIIRNGRRSRIVRGELGGELLRQWQDQLNRVDTVLLSQRRGQQAAVRAACRFRLACSGRLRRGCVVSGGGVLRGAFCVGVFCAGMALLYLLGEAESATTRARRAALRAGTGGWKYYRGFGRGVAECSFV